MPNFIQAHLRYIPLLAATFVTILGSEAAAQSKLERCFAEPKAACSDVLIDRISALQSEMKSAEDVALSQVKLAQVLAKGGRVEAAEAVINNIAPPSSRPAVKDIAIVSLIQARSEDTGTRNSDLLAQVLAPDRYEMARASHIANLAQSGNVDVAVAEAATTNRANQPLLEFALANLAQALLQNGQLETAWKIVDQYADKSSRWPVLNIIMENRLAAGQYNEARATISRMKETSRRAISTAQLAAALTRSGQSQQGKDSFAKARQMLAEIDDPEMRFIAFDGFAQVVVNAGEIDMALAAAQDAGSNRFDYADALLTVARISANINNDAKWQPIITDAIAVLMDGAAQGLKAEDSLNQIWSNVISVTAATGEAEWAADLIGKITSKQQRSQELNVLVTSLIDAEQLETALRLLPLQTDGDVKAQGFLRVALAASETGKESVKQEAMEVVIGLVEGPNEIEISDETNSLLALWEASAGNLKAAEMRVRFVDELSLQARARIMIARYAAKYGNDEEYTNYLAGARAVINQVEQPTTRASLIRYLTTLLAMHGKAQDTFAIIQQEPDQNIRDELSLSSSLMFGNLRQFDKAMAAIANISDPAERMKIEHGLLISLLQLSLVA